MRSLDKVTDADIRKHQPMVRKMVLALIAKLPASIEKDDLMQVGMIAVADQLVQFDAEKVSADSAETRDMETAFLRFAGARVKGAMIDHLRGLDSASRQQRSLIRKMGIAVCALEHRGERVCDASVALELGVTEQDVRDLSLVPSLVNPGSFDSHYAGGYGGESYDFLDMVPARSACGALDLTEDALIQKQKVQAVLKAVRELPDSLSRVVQMYHFEDLNLKQIGTHFGITESAACARLKTATERLTVKLRERDARPALPMQPQMPLKITQGTRWG